MKKFLLCTTLGLSVFALTSLQAQNKSLGVGTSTPNSNAALHVESPTSNQGFIMPRLTTAQRTAMGPLLTAADNGLMLYDTDLKTIYIWDGAAWKSTAEVAGGARLTFPYKDSVVTATGTNDLFLLQYNNPELKRLMRVENLNAENAASALSVATAGTGAAGYFENTNDTTRAAAVFGRTRSNYDGGGLAPVAVYGESIGSGALASSFRISNVDNPHPAIWAETNGTGATLHGYQIGNGSAIVGEIVNDTSSATGMFITTNGTGAVAHFKKTGTSGQAAVLVETDGGHGVFANNNSPFATAGVFQNINSANPSSALYAESGGNGASIWALKSTDAIAGDAILAENWITSGSAGKFQVTDAANADHAIVSTTEGTGSAVFAQNNNPSAGSAGFFVNDNATNSYPALQAEHHGSGPGLAVYQTPTATGNGIHVHMQNTTGTSPAVSINHDGMGNGLWMQSANTSNNSAVVHATNAGVAAAGHFEVNNAGSPSAALYTTTNGTGAALQATTSTGFAAVYGRREGATNGNAGSFEITDAGNTYPALQATNVGPGAAINANHNGTTGDAIYAQVQGNGSAGNFNVDNPASAAAAVWVSTNAIDGNGIGINHTANGRGLSVAAGGMQVSTLTLTGGGTITQRAIAYVVDANVYTFDGGVSFAEGDILYVFNTDVQSATVDGTLISPNTGRVFIYLAGALRAF